MESNITTGTIRGSRSLDNLQRAVELNPKDAVTVNNLAWLLSTCSIEGVRDGSKGVELAEEFCSATRYRVAAYVDTLAVAYAEAGRFADAVDTATTALNLEESELTSRQMRRRLELYKAGKRYRDATPDVMKRKD